MNIITLPELKSYLKITDTDSDVVLGLLISGVNEHIIASYPLSEADVVNGVPADMKLAALIMASRRFQKLGHEGMSSVSASGASVTFKDGEDADVKSLLAKFRRFHV